MTGKGEQTTRREAVLTQTAVEGTVTRAQYRWNTGEISQISVPANFCFDPAMAIRPGVYRQSEVASREQLD